MISKKWEEFVLIQFRNLKELFFSFDENTEKLKMFFVKMSSLRKCFQLFIFFIFNYSFSIFKNLLDDGKIQIPVHNVIHT